MRRRKQEKIIQLTLFIATLVMTILRFLLNEKGRVSPDSIRFMRSAKVFPVIDNTTTPLGYPLSLKFFTSFGFDEFWSSKIVGIFAYLFLLYFSWKKKFYFREILITGALFSYVSIFSYTMSEALILPAVLIFLFIAKQIIVGNLQNTRAILSLTLLLILLYNIRYSALFFIVASVVFGIFNFKKHYAKTFIISGVLGLFFVVLYKFFFIDYFNEKYVQQFLEIGLHSTSKLLTELFQGLGTTFNPFIHIANPAGGIINTAIYGIGVLTVLLMSFIFIRNGLSESEKFLVLVGICGIICSYFIQYFYSVNPLDYRLLSPFVLPLWLVFFKKLYSIFGKSSYVVPALSLMTGFAFTWLSKGNYLENRKNAEEFLSRQKLNNKPILYFAPNPTDLDNVQIAELLSTVNSNLSFTSKPADTLKPYVLTEHKVLKKMKIIQNEFQ